jgi:hypothetical protein
MTDLDDSTLVGLGSAALGYIIADRERLTDFELWLATETETIPCYSLGRTWHMIVEAAQKSCARASMALRTDSHGRHAH